MAMGESEANRFSAAPSALGYLAQMEYALLIALRRLDVAVDFEVGVETLDDVVFHDASGDSAWDPRVLLTLETRMEHGNQQWCAAEAAEVPRRAA
jgi:hypothetical protein